MPEVNKLCGFVWCHGNKDFGVWETDAISAEDQAKIEEILAKYDTRGVNMADIELVIKIPEDIYKDIMTHNRERREGGKSAYYFEGLIQNGTPLSEGHGRIIDENKITKCEQVGLIIKDGNITRCLVTDAPTIIEKQARWKARNDL